MDMGLEQEDMGQRQLVVMDLLAMGMMGKDLKQNQFYQTPEAAFNLSVSSLGVLELVVGVWVGQKLGAAAARIRELDLHEGCVNALSSWVSIEKECQYNK